MNRAQQERSTSAEINTRRIRREGLGKASQSKNARTQKKVTCACLDSPFIIMIEARNPLIQTYVFRFSTRYKAMINIIVTASRSEERRGGKECVSRCRFRW